MGDGWSWFDDIAGEHSNGDEESEDSGDDEEGSEENVFASEPAHSGNEEALGASKARDRVAAIDLHVIGAGLEIDIDNAMEFVKVLKSCQAHPHHKVLISDAVVNFVRIPRGRPWAEFFAPVCVPRNAVFAQWDLGRAVFVAAQVEGIVKLRESGEAAGDDKLVQIKAVGAAAGIRLVKNRLAGLYKEKGLWLKAAQLAVGPAGGILAHVLVKISESIVQIARGGNGPVDIKSNGT